MPAVRQAEHPVLACLSRPAQGGGQSGGVHIGHARQPGHLVPQVQGLSLPEQGGGLILPRLGLGGQILLIGQALVHAGLGDGLSHIAVVPGLVAIAGDGLLVLGIAQHKAEFGAVFLEPGVFHRVLEVGADAGGVDVQGQAGLVLGVAGPGGIALGIGLAVDRHITIV